MDNYIVGRLALPSSRFMRQTLDEAKVQTDGLSDREVALTFIEVVIGGSRGDARKQGED